MEENYESLEPKTYSTGSTNPPKKSGCLFAFLLMAAIFFIGIFSVLGAFNFRLWRRIEISAPNETVSIVVSVPLEEIAPAQAAKICVGNPLGITAESIPLAYQMYYNLPNGLHITYVEPGSAADEVGIEEGDILLRVENTSVTSNSELESALYSYVPGDTVKLIIYRNGMQYSVSVTLGEAHG